MGKLLRREKETVIVFNEADSFADISTYSKYYNSKLQSIAEEYPEYCKEMSSDSDGCKRWMVNKHLLSLRKPWSLEGRRKARERLLSEESPFKKSQSFERN